MHTQTTELQTRQYATHLFTEECAPLELPRANSSATRRVDANPAPANAPERPNIYTFITSEKIPIPSAPMQSDRYTLNHIPNALNINPVPARSAVLIKNTFIVLILKLYENNKGI